MNHKLLTLLVVAICIALGACSSNPADREAKYLTRGKTLLQKNDPSRALLEFRNASKAMPKDAEPYYQLAMAHLQLNDVGNGIAALQKAVELNPKHSAARLKLAELMAASSNKGMVEEARKRLSGMLVESPGDADILNALAYTEARLGEVGDAEKHLEEALAKAPSQLRSSIILARLKMSQGDMAAAQQTLQKAVEQAPKSIEASLALAWFYLVQHRIPEAETEIRRSLALDPKNALALQTLAAIQMTQGNASAAEETYRRVAALPDKRYRALHAAFLFQQGQRAAAITELERLNRQDPQDRDIRTRLVTAYVAGDRIPDAERVLAAAIKKYSNDTDALLQRSGLYLRAGKYAEAKADLTQVLHQKPDSATARYALSRAEGGLGFGEEQQNQLHEAIRLDPNLLPARIELSRIYMAKGQASAAVDLMNQTPEAQKGSMIARTGRIATLLASGDQPAARTEIDRALAVARAPEALLEDATLKIVQKNFPAARVSLEEVLKADPASVPAWRRLALTYYQEQQLPKVEPRLREVAEQNPKASGLHYLLAEVLLSGGKRKEAESVLAAIAAADPSFLSADLMLAQMEIEDGSADPARQLLIGVLAKNATNLPARLILADLENKTGNVPAAIAHYRAALELDRSNVAALNNLAYLVGKEQPDEALGYAQKAAELAPDSAPVLDTLGWIYYRKGMYQQAVDHLRNAVARGDTPLRKYHLALAYLKVGDREQGQIALRAALQADPNLPKKELDW